MAQILFVASNATAIPFDFAAELERLESARNRAPGAFSLAARWSLSAADLRQLLEDQRPDILHLLSPGVNPHNHALMLDVAGRVEYVAPGPFAKIFDLPKPPSLVVLNTCHSLQHAQAIAPHCGSVIAMRGVIYDTAAIEFASALYESLAAGASVATAFEQGRQAIAQFFPDQVNQPVLFTGTIDPTNLTFTATHARTPPRVVTRGPSASPTLKARPVKVFCSYAHADDKFRAQLEKHLATLSLQEAIHVWHDRQIKPGENWAAEIDQNLEEAELILLLISADFMASRYCTGIEMARALEREQAGAAKVVPILIRACDLEGAPFAALQWLPTGSKPVKNWPDRDQAWTNVVKGIRQVVASLQTRGSRAHLTR